MVIDDNVISRVHAFIDEHSGEALERLITLASQPSIANRNEGVEECCQLAYAMLSELDFDSLEILRTPSKPAILAEKRTSEPGMPTVLFYGHYDVQPAEPIELWTTPPFTPTVRDGRIYGRGVADNKGQFLGHVEAIRAWLAVYGELPVNVRLILDGEEEDGSRSMPWIIENYRDRLMADLVYVSDAGIYAQHTPVIYYGNRGALSLEMELTTASMDNHSGNKGGVIRSAAWDMVKLLASMVDDNGNVTIPGYYDTALAPNKLQQQMMDELEFDPEELKKLWGVDSLVHEDSKFDHYNALMFRPTFNINGLSSGFTGQGIKTIIPGSAKVKIDVRLVDGERADDMFALIKNYVASVNPAVKVTKCMSMETSVTDPSRPAMEIVRHAVETAYGVKPVNIPLMGGSLPVYVFKELLGVDVINVPYANPDEMNHAPNENLTLWCFEKGMHCSAQFLAEFAELKK